MEKLVERFLNYVTFDTKSDPSNQQCPSSPGQNTFAEVLKSELVALGLADVSLDKNGYLMAKLPSNVDYAVPAIGFVAHMDTAPDASGANVKPQVIKDYQGGTIELGTSGESLNPSQYPDLDGLHGHDLITTDGTTLLGADNKAGIAEIISAIAHLKANPDIKHGDICIGFTPDEEIGRGANLFDVEKFGAEWAYTIDGGPVGELEFENFNATSADVICHGVNVHPGTAKGKMVNSMNIAAQFQLMMPAQDTPECTEGYEGFYHLKSAEMGVARSELGYIIRDFEREGVEARKTFMQQKVDELNERLEKGRVELVLTDSYFNMKEMVEPHQHIIELAKQAMIECDVEPMIKPIRGGTDGARLSFMGLPCPNIFTGGYNFHGIHEFITIQGMEQAVKVIVELSQRTATHYQK
ncbi:MULTISPECIES: peptidase T [Vibrio]|jgi:tripeptide aminopeptidase|uniref:peptidase T n=1 Tax=Vibrio TaxID=662 RepID=UPI00029A7432|nr:MULTISPECIES: peptidase T [Vibrio]KNH11067.1 peptidase T [Vibrio lentus]MBY7659721.1 peptidase T [Vibrio atlanticus]ERM58034.1 Tripeptide aminopeptidase [Vibrio cyclitrophicus FF75]MBE8604453.1 peptidase T [Vibrio sp. OPT10]MBU2932957.1 peptidase T [Vibrio cyclitrophicus]|tara:strand:+ start:725 stop:1957 length:1233 start_codon:yes stop_codon:yes gene_type:complete